MEGRVFAIYVMFIALAESVTTFVDPMYGFSMHALILICMLILSALKYADNPSSNFFLSLSLAPLIRIISLSLPLMYFPRYAWYLLAGLAVFLATLASIRVMGMSLHEAGVNFNKPISQFAVGMTGVPLGLIEYFILKPEYLAPGLSLLELTLLASAFIFFTGFVEELVFRGVLQRFAIEALGLRAGLLGTAIVFAILHIGWLSILDLIFVFLIGLLFGLIVFKTGSIMGVSISHGLTNVLLFLLLPKIL